MIRVTIIIIHKNYKTRVTCAKNSKNQQYIETISSTIITTSNNDSINMQ